MKIEKKAKQEYYNAVMTPSSSKRYVNFTAQAMDAMLGDKAQGDVELYLVCEDNTDAETISTAKGVRIRVSSRSDVHIPVVQGFRLKRPNTAGRRCGSIASMDVSGTLYDAFGESWVLEHNEFHSKPDEVVFMLKTATPEEP